MSLESSIQALVEQGVVAALERHLPALLKRFIVPGDPDERLNIEEAATALRLPVKTVRQRISSGQLLAFRDGVRLFILRSDMTAYNTHLRDATQFKRNQAARRRSTKRIQPDIAALLQPGKPSNSATNKKTH